MELTGFGRCDRCAARGYIRVELFSGLDLVFCGHHFAPHRKLLEEQSLRIENQMQELIDSCP